MTLDEALMFFDHFKRYPALRVLVHACAMALGVKLPTVESAPEQKKSKYMTAEDTRRFVQMTRGGRDLGLGHG